MLNIETELENQLPIEQLALLHKQSFTAFAATIAVLLYILYWIHDSVDGHLLSLWVGAIIVLNIYLLFWIYFVHKAIVNARLDTNKAKRFILIYQLQSLLHGSSWGVLPFLLIEVQTPEMKFFAYIILCGLAAGAIGTTAMIFRIYLSFMLSMMLPTIFSQFLLADNFSLFSQNTLGVLTIFVISLIVLAHSHYDSIKRSITLMVENGQLLTDVTEAFSKTATASQAKSNFLANMSHELRTPLNAVIGYSEIISDSAKDHDFDSIPKDAKKITKAGKHLLALINNVLDLSKIESGKMDVFIEDVNLYQLLIDTSATTNSLLTKNKNTLNFDVPDDLPIIKSDSTKLRQILLNILSNAAKFTSNGVVTIKALSFPDNIEVTISDTGIGMTEKQLQDLTTPFTQADISTTRNYGGTGLGMNLTEHLTKLLEIEMKASSILDKGTTFMLVIPLTYKANDIS